VLIGASEKVSVHAALTLVPVDNVGDDGRVQVPEMRQAVGVIDRSCDVKALHLQKDKV
jgi:hypothetical protein